jgi:hypothetical protein
MSGMVLYTKINEYNRWPHCTLDVLLDDLTFAFLASFFSSVWNAKEYIYIGPVHTSEISSAIFSFWGMWTSKSDANVQVRKHALSTFVIDPLVHIYQKEKIAAKNRSRMWTGSWSLNYWVRGCTNISSKNIVDKNITRNWFSFVRASL